MSAHPREEVQAAADRYRNLREAIARGEQDWPALADLFTDDAVYIDPAWGRIEGRDEIRTFMTESMTGLEDWTFPIEFIAIEGDDVVIKWTQILPGTTPDDVSNGIGSSAFIPTRSRRSKWICGPEPSGVIVPLTVCSPL